MDSNHCNVIFSIFTVTLTDSCSSDDECRVAIDNSNCTANNCVCHEHTVENGNSCNILDMDDLCTTDAQCNYGVINSTCISGRCSCPLGYIHNLIENKCELRMLTDSCDTSEDCSTSVANSACTEGIYFIR